MPIVSYGLRAKMIPPGPGRVRKSPVLKGLMICESKDPRIYFIYPKAIEIYYKTKRFFRSLKAGALFD